MSARATEIGCRKGSVQDPGRGRLVLAATWIGLIALDPLIASAPSLASPELRRPRADRWTDGPTKRTGTRTASFSLCGLATLLLSLIVMLASLSGSAQILNESRRITEAENGFGRAVAIHNGICAVANPYGNSTLDIAYPVRLFDCQSGALLHQLSPDVAGTNHAEAGFGRSIAMDAGLIVVGVWGSETAFLFDALTGMLLHELIPSDGSLPSDYGWSVAIDGGRVVVGSRDAGSSAAAYVFDASSGEQVAKFVSNGSGPQQRFGYAVAIDGSQVAVGAPGDNWGDGAVYLFDAITGLQMDKLSPNSPEDDGLGVAVAMDEGVLAAAAGNINGSTPGSVIVFDAVGNELRRLTQPESDEPFNSFGYSVDVDDGIVVVGAGRAYTARNGDASGVAFLFDIAPAGGRLAKLHPYKGREHLVFGTSVAIDNGVTIVGADLEAFIYDADRDADGLLDDWEINGIPYVDANGIEQRLPLPDADPLHKDLYVEVDAMMGFGLSTAAVVAVENSFALAPISNPDGVRGIDLHIVRDDTAMTHEEFFPLGPAGTDARVDFLPYRESSFGTSAERASPSKTELQAVKAKAYRYTIIADKNSEPNGPIGLGQNGGDNVVLFFGYECLSGVIREAGAFMHELGHNLGLDHGGFEDTNAKPNYPSVMNYLMVFPYPWNEDFWELDYSRKGREEFGDSLFEFSLDETRGIGRPDGVYSHYRMPVGVDKLDGSGNAFRSHGFVPLDGTPYDFGSSSGSMIADGVLMNYVDQDLNYMGSLPGRPLPGPSPGEVLEPYNDWANISLKTWGSLGVSDAAPLVSDEPGIDILDGLEALPEPGFASILFVGFGALAALRRREALAVSRRS